MRWNAPRRALILLALLTGPPAPMARAAESFLSDNAKAPDAIPYGRSIGAAPPPTPAADAASAESPGATPTPD